MSFRSWSLKRQFSIVTSSLFLGCALVFGLIIFPTIGHMRNINQDIRDIQKELENEYVETQAMKRTLRELDTVFDEIEVYDAMTIKTGEELATITEIESLASTYDVSQSLGISFHETPDSVVKLPYYELSLVVTGSYDHIFTYLEALEEKPYYVLIHSLSLSQAAEGATTLRCNARIYVSN